MFELTIQYTAGDLQRAYQIHYRKGYPVGSRLLMILGVISLVFGTVLMLYSYLSLHFTNWFAWFLVVYGVLVIVFYYWRFYTMGKRMFKKMPDFEHPYHYVFSEDGIRAQSVNVNSDNAWAYYNRCIIEEDMIILYPNRYRFNFFAKRHFSPEQFETLKKWVREKVVTH